MNPLVESSSGAAKESQAPSVVRAINLSESAEAHPVSSIPVLDSLNPLHQVKAHLQVCVGEAVMTVGELLGAKEHQVVRLDRTVDQPVDLILEGKVIARGQLVAVDDHFAVRITELPVSLKV
jgi:flagellar motor switch protein FliN/FliY